MFSLKIAKTPLFGAALLCATLPAVAAEESNSGATGRVAPIHHATINCPGVTSVPTPKAIRFTFASPTAQRATSRVCI